MQQSPKLQKSSISPIRICPSDFNQFLLCSNKLSNKMSSRSLSSNSQHQPTPLQLTLIQTPNSYRQQVIISSSKNYQNLPVQINQYLQTSPSKNDDQQTVKKVKSSSGVLPNSFRKSKLNNVSNGNELDLNEQVKQLKNKQIFLENENLQLRQQRQSTLNEYKKFQEIKQQEILMMKQHISQLEQNLLSRANLTEKTKPQEAQENHFVQIIQELTAALNEKTIQLERLQSVSTGVSRSKNQMHYEDSIKKLQQESNKQMFIYSQNQNQAKCSIDIDSMNSENQKLNLINKQLQEQVEELKLKQIRMDQNQDLEEVDILRNEITKLKIQDTKYQEEFKKFFDKFEKQQQELNQVKQSEKRIETLQKEIDSWKGRFTKLNREYHLLQEQLVMVLAELDNCQYREPNGQSQNSIFTAYGHTQKIMEIMGSSYSVKK